MKSTESKKARKNTVSRNKYSIEDKEKARKYYIMGLNLKEISKLLDGCPVRTLEKWQQSGNWTILKKSENTHFKVLEMAEAGKSYTKIAEILKISRVTVWRHIKRAKNFETAKNG